MPDDYQVTDEHPINLHYTQNYHHLNYQTQQQQQVQNQTGAAKNKKLFPKKLWDLINDDKYHDCLRWSDDGQLVYLNRDDFEDSYLKTAENQFHTQKAISFVRQMNMYGFRKVDDCYYENDNFKRDSEHLLKNMIRKHPSKNQINEDISQLSFHNHNLYDNVSTNSTRITTPLSISTTSPTSLLQAATPTSLLKTSAATTATTTATTTTTTTTQSDVSLLAPSNFIDASYLAQLAFQLYGNGTPIFNPRDDNILTNQPPFDINMFPNLQQLYQSLLLSQDCFAPSETPHQNSQTSGCSDSSGIQSSASNGTDSTASSLLVWGAYGPKQEKNSDYSTENGFKADFELDGKTNDRYKRKFCSETDSSPVKRRDNKANRSFKRSIDSILDSHDNYSLGRSNGWKKTIIDYDGARNADNNGRISKIARELVTQVALHKAARIDSDVLSEVSRYTERFVKTLFDTAQVIARHSNASSSSDSINGSSPNSEHKESKSDIESDRRNINLSDITSAVKLLPSKLPKIFK